MAANNFAVKLTLAEANTIRYELGDLMLRLDAESKNNREQIANARATGDQDYLAGAVVEAAQQRRVLQQRHDAIAKILDAHF
jgi:hypothetical protein